MSDGIGGFLGLGLGLAVGATALGVAGNVMLKAAKEEGKMFKKKRVRKSAKPKTKRNKYKKK